MSTRNISGGNDGRCVGQTILPPSCADFLGSLNFLVPSGSVQAVNGISVDFGDGPIKMMMMMMIMMSNAVSVTGL
jgi:hypothetical protein